MVSLRILRKRAYLVLTITLTVVLSVLYYAFSLRSADMKLFWITRQRPLTTEKGDGLPAVHPSTG